MSQPLNYSTGWLIHNEGKLVSLGAITWLQVKSQHKNKTITCNFNAR